MQKKPTKAQSTAAVKVQVPTTTAQPTTSIAVAPKPIPLATADAFQSLAARAQSLEVLKSEIDTSSTYIQNCELFAGVEIGVGDESEPFVILRAWEYTSEQLGERIGFEFARVDGSICWTSLPRSGDRMRSAILEHFAMSTEPIGPCILKGVKSNYARPLIGLAPYVAPRPVTSDEDIPF